MTTEELLNEIKAASPQKRDAILSHAYFVLHGELTFDKPDTATCPISDYRQELFIQSAQRIPYISKRSGALEKWFFE